MKKVLATVAVAACLLGAHYLKPAACQSGPVPQVNQTKSSSTDVFHSDAAMRHMTCQPRHWRYLVIHK